MNKRIINEKLKELEQLKPELPLQDFMEDLEEVELNIEEIHKEQDRELYQNDTHFFFNFTSFANNYVTIIYNKSIYLINISGVYLIWIFLHYVASHLYITFCVPKTLYGFVMSPFMIPAPHCQGLRWVAFNSSTTITNMWVVLGTWIYSFILLKKV